MSPAFKKMLGYEDFEISNNADLWLQLIYKEDLSRVVKSYQEHISSGGEVPYENTVRYYHKNGSTIHILSKGHVTEWDAFGNPLKMVGYYADVTGTLHHGSQQQKENERWQQVADAAQLARWQWNIKTGDVEWSDGLYLFTGYTKEEIKASYFTFFHVLINKDDSSRVLQAIDLHIKKNEPFKLEIRMQRKGGAYAWYVIGGKLYTDKSTKEEILMGYVLNKQEAQQNKKNAMPKAFAFKEEHVGLSNIGEWVYNIADENIVWSAEVFKLFELGPDYKPSFENVIELYAEESRPLLQKALGDVVYHQKEYDLDLLCITAKGHKKWVREVGKPILDKDGNLTGIFGVLEDIDKRKRTELSLTESNRLIINKNKRLTNFAHIAAHNLQTHANNLKLTLQHVDSSDNEAEKLFFMEAVKKVSASLNQTLDHLNELVKVDGELEEYRETVYFQTVFDNVVNALSRNINETAAHVQGDFSRCAYVTYVPAYLESILQNLISNAIKYRQPGKNPLVVVRSYIKNGYKILSIKDNGQGIDLDKHGSKIFGLYKTFHQNPEAHGIGLFMTKNQVEAMGGSIQVESEPGIGTTFIIQFNETEDA